MQILSECEFLFLRFQSSRIIRNNKNIALISEFTVFHCQIETFVLKIYLWYNTLTVVFLKITILCSKLPKQYQFHTNIMTSVQYKYYNKVLMTPFFNKIITKTFSSRFIYIFVLDILVLTFGLWPKQILKSNLIIPLIS